MSLQPIDEEEHITSKEPQIIDQRSVSHVLSEVDDPSNALLDLTDSSQEYPTLHTRRTRNDASGNSHVTVVHQTGIYDMEVLFCICDNASKLDVQLFQAHMLPSSFKNIETAFTFSILDDFLTDNLECKTTAQQYFLKLQSLTNKMFPDNVPVCRTAL